MEEHGLPVILKTDQGSQLTVMEFADRVAASQQGIRQSMDGNGRDLDNIFVERLCRYVKYDHVYIIPVYDGP